MFIHVITAVLTVTNNAGAYITSVSVSGKDAGFILTIVVAPGQTLNGQACTINFASPWAGTVVPSVTPGNVARGTVYGITPSINEPSTYR